MSNKQNDIYYENKKEAEEEKNKSAQELGRLSQKKNPLTSDVAKKMQRKSVEAKRKKKEQSK